MSLCATCPARPRTLVWDGRYASLPPRHPDGRLLTLEELHARVVLRTLANFDGRMDLTARELGLAVNTVRRYRDGAWT